MVNRCLPLTETPSLLRGSLLKAGNAQHAAVTPNALCTSRFIETDSAEEGVRLLHSDTQNSPSPCSLLHWALYRTAVGDHCFLGLEHSNLAPKSQWWKKQGEKVAGDQTAVLQTWNTASLLPVHLAPSSEGLESKQGAC